MQFEIKHIHENLGVTMVYVTHDQSEALTMSNRIAVFEDGIIQQLATPDVLYEQPKNAFVAYFIGENNRLYGKVKSANGEYCEVELEGSGQSVQALKVNVDGAGDRTTLSLRPERVTVNPKSDECENVLDAHVEELIYLGDHIRTRVTVAGNEDFVVKIPNAHGHVALREGEDVKVGWAADDCRALDA
jgi:putative spermidine/putrescine transport system ATP-binding protein